METVKEWLEKLPEGYRERAVANMENPDRESSCLNHAVSFAFSWAKTPEGHDFWLKVCLWAGGLGELPPLPESVTYDDLLQIVRELAGLRDNHEAQMRASDLAHRAAEILNRGGVTMNNDSTLVQKG